MEKENAKSLLSQWKDRQNKSGPKPIGKAPSDISSVLTYMQQRLWFLQQLNKDNPFYNYADLYSLKGPLNVTNLHKALELVYTSHDVLRSTFSVENGVVRPKISANTKLDILTYDLSKDPKPIDQKNVSNILNADVNKAFVLESGPLIRVSLIKLSPIEHFLLLTLHHIVTDKWSMGIFRGQLAKYYSALEAGEEITLDVPSIQYYDYAHWLQNRPISDNQVSYWKEKLAGDIPLLDLPKDFAPTSLPSYKGAFDVMPFSNALSKEVLALAASLETTPYVLLLSVYFVLLHRYSGQNDILVGSPISNRDQKSLEDLIGFFNDTVVLRIDLDPEMTFDTLVKKVRQTTMEAFANKDVPFNTLVKALNPERSLSVNPFFQVMFLYHDVPAAPDFGPDLELSHAPYDAKVAKFDLTLYISNDQGSLTSIFEFATDLFSHETILRFQNYLKLLLEGVTRNPEHAISKIPMITQAEKELFYPSGIENQEETHLTKPIHRFIEEIAKKSPSKKALAYKERSIDYGELDRRADAIAHIIHNKTIGKNEIVGLCIDRSPEMIIGMLAILKSGCAYLPIDPEYPEQRVKLMIEDTDVKLILTSGSTATVANRYDAEVLNMDEIDSSTDNDNYILPEVAPDTIAYVIYTSGSTGRPKGVPITHKSIVNSTLGRTEFYGKDPDSFLLLSSIAFDSSKAGIFWTLCTGGTLVISEKRIEQDIDLLTKTIQRNNVSHTLMLPSLYASLLDHITVSDFQSLSTIMVAGEACPISVCAKHFETLPEVELYNEYGPTEATVWCVAHKIVPEDLQSTIPIGKPVANAHVHILNDDLENVPFGAVGELCISGVGLTNGYINLPADNARHFAEISLEPDSNMFTRIYRTGDLVRYGRNGTIEFLGRKDQQVKIRGFRIELDEIEKVILNNKSVEKVFVSVESEQRLLEIVEMECLETDELLKKAASNVGLEELEEILQSVENLSAKEQDFLSNKL